jgi:dihydrofolate reductase
MKAVAAMSLNRVIGRGGEIPWHLPEDFRWFKELTTGGIVLMGRKTFASLPKPLPNRSNVVFTRAPRLLSRDPEFLAKAGGRVLVGHWAARLRKESYQLGFERLASREVWLVGSPLRWLRAVEKYQPKREIFVIGGAQIYERFLPHCTDLFLTVVFREVEGDALFPNFERLFGVEYQVVRKTADFEVRHFRQLPA